MQPESRKLLFDVERAIVALQSFTEGRTLEDFTKSVMLRSACERQLEIIGEAMGRLRDVDEASFGAFTEGAKIIGLRNRLIHGYDAVNAKIVWDVIQQKLGTLLAEVARIAG